MHAGVGELKEAETVPVPSCAAALAGSSAEEAAARRAVSANARTEVMVWFPGESVCVALFEWRRTSQPKRPDCFGKSAPRVGAPASDDCPRGSPVRTSSALPQRRCRREAILRSRGLRSAGDRSAAFWRGADRRRTRVRHGDPGPRLVDWTREGRQLAGGDKRRVQSAAMSIVRKDEGVWIAQRSSCCGERSTTTRSRSGNRAVCRRGRRRCGDRRAGRAGCAPPRATARERPACTVKRRPKALAGRGVDR